jgi:hypothetical protein
MIYSHHTWYNQHKHGLEAEKCTERTPNRYALPRVDYMQTGSNFRPHVTVTLPWRGKEVVRGGRKRRCCVKRGGANSTH